MLKPILLLLIFLIFTNAQAEQKKVTLQLLWKNQFEFAGFYMAKEKGFYKDVGIDVELKEYQFGTDIAKEVSTGNIQFGVESSSLILDKTKGLDVYLLMPVLQTSPFVLMCKKRDDIKTVSDLKGKKIMVTPNQVAMASLNAMLKVNNINNNDYIAQEHSFNSQDLIDGKTDAISAYLSNEPYHLIEKNIAYTIFNPADYGFNFYDNIIFTSKKLFEKDPNLVRNFYEASKKGWDYAFNNIEESAKIVYEKYNTQNKSLEHLIYEAKELKKLSAFGTNLYQKFKPEIISQIVQTYNLLDISKQNVNFDELIYEDAIYKESGIDFSLLIKILLGVLVVFLGLFFWNRKLNSLNTQIKISKNKISVLLDNAGQGFLTFDNHFIIDEEYSKECIKLLGNDIANKDITTLLFNDESKKKIFKDALINAINDKNPIKRNSYLSLLPSTIILNKKALKLEYKIIDNGTIMLIITNITSEKKLENKIKKEQQTFKMIVTIVSESEVFYDAKKDYIDFITNYKNYIDTSKEPLYNINHIYRIIHTFKGTFSQLFMNKVVEFLHKIENNISLMVKDSKRTNEKLLFLLENTDFYSNFEETLELINDILGNEFLESENYLKVDIKNINDLQEKIANILSTHMETTPECQEVLCQVQSLSSLKLYTMLKPYTIYSKQLATRLEKDIYDFDILGDTDIEVNPIMKPFVKSLIHIFRNCVDHGIELPEERLEKNKDEKGSIGCTIEKKDDKIHIVIADNGKGIDIDAIKEKAKHLGIDTTNFSEQQILALIFNDNFTTTEHTSDISGRGIGLASVKYECEKIDGKIKIDTQKNGGTTFEFII